MLKHTSKLVMAAAALSMVALGGTVQAKTKWNLPTGFPTSNFHTQNIQMFIDEVRDKSGGEFEITLHPNASLFKYVEVKRAVQTGRAEIGEFGPFVHSNEWDIYELDNLPFLVAGYDDAWALYQASRKTIDDKLDEQGMVGLYAVAWPPQGLYSKKPIESAQDLQGMKWRAYSPTTAKIAELVGAQPVSVQAPELSQAMATGVVEAFITSSQTGVDTKVQEYLKHYYTLNAWLPKNMVIVNKKAFEALSPELREILLEAAANAEKRGWEMSRKVNQDSIDTLVAEGVSVEEPSAQLTSDMQAIGQTLLDDWLSKADDQGKAIVAEYQKLR